METIIVRDPEDLRMLGEVRKVEFWYQAEMEEVLSFFLDRAWGQDEIQVSGFFREETGEDFIFLRTPSFNLEYRRGTLKIRSNGELGSSLSFLLETLPIQELELDCTAEELPSIPPLELRSLALRGIGTPFSLSMLRTKSLTILGPQSPSDLLRSFQSLPLGEIEEVRGVALRTLEELRSLVSLFPKVTRFSFQGPPLNGTLGKAISSLFPKILFFDELHGIFQEGRKVRLGV